MRGFIYLSGWSLWSTAAGLCTVYVWKHQPGVQGHCWSCLKTHLGNFVLAETSPKCKKYVKHKARDILEKKTISMTAAFCVLGESQVSGAAGDGCPGAALELQWCCNGVGTAAGTAAGTGAAVELSGQGCWHTWSPAHPHSQAQQKRWWEQQRSGQQHSPSDWATRSCEISWALQRRSLT